MGPFLEKLISNNLNLNIFRKTLKNIITNIHEQIQIYTLKWCLAIVK